MESLIFSIGSVFVADPVDKPAAGIPLTPCTSLVPATDAPLSSMSSSKFKAAVGSLSSNLAPSVLFLSATYLSATDGSPLLGEFSGEIFSTILPSVISLLQLFCHFSLVVVYPII